MAIAGCATYTLGKETYTTNMRWPTIARQEVRLKALLNTNYKFTRIPQVPNLFPVKCHFCQESVDKKKSKMKEEENEILDQESSLATFKHASKTKIVLRLCSEDNVSKDKLSSMNESSDKVKLNSDPTNESKDVVIIEIKDDVSLDDESKDQFETTKETNEMVLSAVEIKDKVSLTRESKEHIEPIIESEKSVEPIIKSNDMVPPTNELKNKGSLIIETKDKVDPTNEREDQNARTNESHCRAAWIDESKDNLALTKESKDLVEAINESNKTFELLNYGSIDQKHLSTNEIKDNVGLTNESQDKSAATNELIDSITSTNTARCEIKNDKGIPNGGPTRANELNMSNYNNQSINNVSLETGSLKGNEMIMESGETEKLSGAMSPDKLEEEGDKVTARYTTLNAARIMKGVRNGTHKAERMFWERACEPSMHASKLSVNRQYRCFPAGTLQKTSEDLVKTLAQQNKVSTIVPTIR